MKINRDLIINKIGDELKNNSFVFAFWLEGADAHDTVDQYSDIDVWLDVQDGHEGMVIEQVRSILSQIAQLDFDHEADHPHPKIRQLFFHLAGTSEFLIIDVCIQSHSRECWYTKEHADEKVKIIFDKDKVIQFRDMDKTEFQNLQKKRVEELKKTFLFFQAWVMKGVNRGNFLEALSYYHSFILKPLVEILRVRHEPTKREFGLKHIERDVPKDVLETLESLYKVSSTEEIATKTQKANELFFDVLKTIEKENDT
jgi:predicted nucleotidyltransferase